jgi:hypothetical protein
MISSEPRLRSTAALTVAGIATLLTNAVPIAAGTVLLHEPYTFISRHPCALERRPSWAREL